MMTYTEADFAVLEVDMGRADDATNVIATPEVDEGLWNAHWPGRFEVVSENPLLILDGAHRYRQAVVVAVRLAESKNTGVCAFGSLYSVGHAVLEKEEAYG